MNRLLQIWRENLASDFGDGFAKRNGSDILHYRPWFAAIDE
jgi:hypothetical protein